MSKERNEICEYIKRNIICFLTVISFFVIGYDLTTEIAEQKNEIEFYTAILINSTNPAKQIKIDSPKEIQKAEHKLKYSNTEALFSIELSETFQSRPPPTA